MKILFFGLDYHNYTSSIIAEMERLDASVTYVDIQPRCFFLKVLRVSVPSIYKNYIKSHHRKSINNSKKSNYEKVIFLQAHQMSVEDLRELRDHHKNAEFTLYNWDSLSNHDYRSQAIYFDRVLTFDRSDADIEGYGFLPLFCQRSMQRLSRTKAMTRTVYMVGNIVKHERYTAVGAFRDYCVQNGILFREYLKVSPIVWVQLLRKGIVPKNLNVTSIAPTVFHEMIETSLAVFDFANHEQSGQTMRMMESLCSGKKIITSNVWVKDEPFYSPDRILIFKGTDFSCVNDFLDTPLIDPQTEFPEYYIQSFTRQLLGLDLLVSRGSSSD